ncbi:hypothetical protein ACFW9X_03280 [Streptomyces sp. NPDC059466]|uniref:hypothetical protein n=1 Tax=Streptomyces sp. NPDC059466 TaxID=3346843 RepID=UPI0036A45429
MPERTLTPGPTDAITDDIREHGFAILQTRVERISRLVKGLPCQEVEGCTEPATLATFAVDAATEDDTALGLQLVKGPDGNPVCIVICDKHRNQASHDLYYALTGRLRPDGIRAYDAPGRHMAWNC